MAYLLRPTYTPSQCSQAYLHPLTMQHSLPIPPHNAVRPTYTPSQCSQAYLHPLTMQHSLPIPPHNAVRPTYTPSQCSQAYLHPLTMQAGLPTPPHNAVRPTYTPSQCSVTYLHQDQQQGDHKKAQGAPQFVVFDVKDLLLFPCTPAVNQLDKDCRVADGVTETQGKPAAQRHQYTQHWLVI